MFRQTVLSVALTVMLVCCRAGVVKREAIGNIDICEKSALDVADGASFDLASPNFGFGSYQNNVDCSVVLTSGDTSLVLNITFITEYIESHSQCSYDSLCLNGVPFCGYWAAGQNFQFLLPEWSSFTLRFRTDGSVTRDGYSIRVEARKATKGETVFQPSSGTGSQARSVLYERVSYYPDLRLTYVDKCATSGYSTGYPGYYPTRAGTPNYYYPTGWWTENPYYYPTGTWDYYPTGTPDYYPTRWWTEDYYPTGTPDYYPTGTPDYYPTGTPYYYRTGTPDYYPTGTWDYYPTGTPDYYPTRWWTEDYYPTGTRDYYPTGTPDYYPTGNPDYYPTGTPDYYPTRWWTEDYYPTGTPDYYPTGTPYYYRTENPDYYPTGTPDYYPTGTPYY